MTAHEPTYVFPDVKSAFGRLGGVVLLACITTRNDWYEYSVPPTLPYVSNVFTVTVCHVPATTVDGIPPNVDSEADTPASNKTSLGKKAKKEKGK